MSGSEPEALHSTAGESSSQRSGFGEREWREFIEEESKKRQVQVLSLEIFPLYGENLSLG